MSLPQSREVCLAVLDLQYLGLAWNGLGDESCRHLASAFAV